MTFNLLDEPWLPCYDLEGRFHLLGIRQALVDAHKLRELRDADPLATCALQRLLLAVLHRSLNGPKSMKAWIGVWERGSFDEAPLERYLKKWEERFDLFGAEHPFYQVGKFETEDPVPVAKLSEDLAKKNNATLFDHSMDAASRKMPLAEAARRLVTCQAFAFGGGKSSKSNKWKSPPNFEHAPLVGGVCAMLKGHTLFECLTLNLLVMKDDQPVPSLDEDSPAWERDKADKPGKHACRGWLDLLTWQSRYIRLIAEDGGVSAMHYSQGLSMEKEARPREPFWFFKLDAKSEAKTVRPSLDRMMWRDLEGLFAFSVQAKKGAVSRPQAFSQAYKAWDEHQVQGLELSRFSFRVFGLANDKAKPLQWTQQDFSAPMELLKNGGPSFRVFSKAIKGAEDGASSLRKSLWIYARSFLVANKKDAKPAAEDLKRMQEHFGAKHHYWLRLDPEFQEFMEALADDPNPAFDRWMEKIRISVLLSFDEALGGIESQGSRGLKAKVDASAYLDSMLHSINPREREEAMS